MMLLSIDTIQFLIFPLQEEVDRRSAKFVASKKRLQEECETVKVS